MAVSHSYHHTNAVNDVEELEITLLTYHYHTTTILLTYHSRLSVTCHQ